MRRPKALLIRALRRTSRAVTNVGTGMNSRARTERVELKSMRRRLEFLLAAMYGRPFRIEEVTNSRAPGIARRLLVHATRARQTAPLAESDESTIRLPRSLQDSPTSGSAAAQYRLLAIEHAERIARGTAASLPPRSALLERDLYLLAEATAVDTVIMSGMKGMQEPVVNARKAALAARPDMSSLGAMEREVERITREVLTANPEQISPNLPSMAAPAASLEWARETANRIRAVAGARGHVYRGIPPVALWGTVSAGRTASDTRTEDDRMRDLLDSASLLNTQLRQEQGASGFAGAPNADAPESDAQSERGEGGAEADSDPTDETGALREEIGARSGNTHAHDEARTRDDADAMVSDLEALRAASKRRAQPAPHSESIVYPEWDCNAKAYRERGATVRSISPPERATGSADDILAEYGPIVRSLRVRFERLRARRVQLPRQRDGDELDLAACVRSLVDIRTGHNADDRLYVDVLPARRALAITLLVDVSGSTGDPIGGDTRIIDVERIALLLASEALDALGDRYSILTFSSHGAADVRVAPIKTFAERNGETVRQRIVAIEPQGKTRLGAAVRHASAQLLRQPVSRRILLILSDGKPNDTDRYFEHYAAEDTRQAILEAKARGIYPFCLTVDRDEGSEYLAHIFGPAGHTILRQPEQLPFALVKGMQHLLGS